VAPWHGIVIGMTAGLVCFWACTWLKHRFNDDDSSTCSASTASAHDRHPARRGFATAADGGTSADRRQPQQC